MILSTDGQRLLWCPPNSPAYLSTNNGTTWTISTNSQSLTNSNGTETVAVLAGAAGIPGTTNGTGGNARFNSPSAIALDSAGDPLRRGHRQPHHPQNRGQTARSAPSPVARAFPVPPTPPAPPPASTLPPASRWTRRAPFMSPIPATTPSGKSPPPGSSPPWQAASGLTGSTDATGTAARFNSPAGLAVDATGNVFVCDAGNHTIRKITSAGVVTTVAG